MHSNVPVCSARLVFVILLLLRAEVAAADWPQWRGARGDGVSDERGLPAAWSVSGPSEKGSKAAESGPSGIAWVCPLPEWGASTPAVIGDALFVTSHAGRDLLLVRVDAKTGSVAWVRKVAEGEAARMELRLKSVEERRGQKFHRDHNLASPSPVTDGERVIVHFGEGTLASYRLDGELEWKRNLQEDHGGYTIWWGHANSPVIHGDLVVSVCLQDSLGDFQEKLSPSYIVAHDKRTGKERWKTERMTGATSEPCDAYTTPILVESTGGVDLVVLGGGWLDAYEPGTGARKWRLTGLGGNRTITGPVAAGGVIYATVGMRGPLLAVRPEGRGDLDRSKVVAWQHEKGTPDSPCPVVAVGLVFIVSDNGVARCLDAATGAERWSERLGGEHRASPVAGDGKVYFTSVEGRTTVVEASAQLSRLGEGSVDDTVVASPAVSGGRIFVRGRKAIYCAAAAQ